MSDHSYNKILCVRADNMGDVIMSSPAVRALKQRYGSHITLLTSRAGALISPYLDCIDDCIAIDLPWARHLSGSDVNLPALAADPKARGFDAAVIFTVYSQSALPGAMLCMMAGIPVRVAFARENPYGLLTTWMPDHEPYSHIVHQVERDLELARALGAEASDDRLLLVSDNAATVNLGGKLGLWGLDQGTPFLVLHPGVSEEKRQYPLEDWVRTGRLLVQTLGLPILVTGSEAERELAIGIANSVGDGAFAVAGTLSIGEFIEIIRQASCVVSVNTSTIHIAAAVQTPSVVLYAETNPQHTPWRGPHELLSFSVPEQLRSNSPVIRHVSDLLYDTFHPFPTPTEILGAVRRLTGVTGSYPFWTSVRRSDV